MTGSSRAQPVAARSSSSLPPQHPGGLAQRRRDQAVEVEARQVRPSGQVFAAQLGFLEALLDDVEQLAESVGGDHAPIVAPLAAFA